MPIYAYRCAGCGHTKDVLQKLSDPALTVCPACGRDSFSKQLTAAGFQLKGSGWYVTDFRGGSGAAKPAESSGDGAAPAETKTQAKTEGASSSPSGDKPAASGCGGSCACH